MVSLLAILLACAVDDPCPPTAMIDGDQGLVVTQDEHGLGWAETDCWQCHQQQTLHRTGCTPDVDLEAIQARVEAEGLASCAACHGDNGVSR